MKTSLEREGAGFVIELQDPVDEEHSHNLIPFPGLKRNVSQPREFSSSNSLAEAGSKPSQASAGWEGASYLALEFAAIAAVTISLVRALLTLNEIR
jgi:hypothetical protein